MTSKNIYQTALIYFGRDFTKTRKRENVYLRALVNDICKKYTKESLERIGLNTNTDHATVLNSIRNFKEIYVKQKCPFDVEFEYLSFELYLKDVRDDYVRDDYVPDTMVYKEIKNKYDILNIKHSNLKSQYEKLVIETAKQTHQTDERFIPLIEECSKFSNKQLERLIQTRVRPFKLMTEIK